MTTTTTTPTATATRTADPARDRWFLGTLLRIVADAGDTDGQLGVMEQRSARGFSPPLHVHHREDTALLVIEGELTVRVGDTQRAVGPGGFVWLPRDIPHTFRVDSEEARLYELLLPPTFIGFHLETSEPAQTFELPPPAAPDVPALLGAIEPYGAEIVGPPMTSAD